MQVRSGRAAAALLGLITIMPGRLPAQATPPVTPPPAGAQTPDPNGRGGGGRRGGGGGFVPGQQRPPGDPVQIDRGKTLYGINCTGCHGADLRGGDMGGPNLLRSQLALSDQQGELIVPIILGSRQNSGMPAIQMSNENAQ